MLLDFRKAKNTPLALVLFYAILKSRNTQSVWITVSKHGNAFGNFLIHRFWVGCKAGASWEVVVAHMPQPQRLYSEFSSSVNNFVKARHHKIKYKGLELFKYLVMIGRFWQKRLNGYIKYLLPKARSIRESLFAWCFRTDKGTKKWGQYEKNRHILIQLVYVFGCSCLLYLVLVPHFWNNSTGPRSCCYETRIFIEICLNKQRWDEGLTFKLGLLNQCERLVLAQMQLLWVVACHLDLGLISWGFQPASVNSVWTDAIGRPSLMRNLAPLKLTSSEKG